MKDMSLRALLTLGFGTILALLLFVGGYAIVSERSMTADIDDLANRRLPATVGYGMLNIERMRIRSQTLEVLNLRFPAEQTTAVLNDVAKARADSWEAVEQRLGEVDKLPRVSAEAQRQHDTMLAQYKEWRQHYVGLDATIAGMTEASKAEDFNRFAELHAQYGRQYEAMLPVSRTLGATLDEINAAQVERANSDAARAAADGARALAITVVLMAAGLVLGAVTGFMIYRAVMNQVGGEPAYANKLLRQVASGDLTVDIALRASDRSSMLFALREMVNQLKGLVGIISDNANHIAAASEQLSAASDSIASASDEQSQSATSMAASVEEMTVSINHVSNSATDADRMAKQSGEAARSGSDAIRNVVADINRIAREVAEATESIEELGVHSREISSVVTIIRELADQTNLLALNAAIERRAPVIRAAASPSWPTRCASSPSVPPARPTRSPASSARFIPGRNVQSRPCVVRARTCAAAWSCRTAQARPSKTSTPARAKSFRPSRKSRRHWSNNRRPAPRSHAMSSRSRR